MTSRQQLCAWLDAARACDEEQTLTYHSWVLPDRKALCVTVPKVACSRIKLSLHLLEGNPAPAHLGDVHDAGTRLATFDRERQLEILTSPEWFRCCFVRNPYERLLSAYQTQVGNTWNRQYQWLKDGIRTWAGLPAGDGAREQLVSFRECVRYLHATTGRVRHDGHFNVQAHILVPHLIPYDVVGRFETFARDFTQVLQRLGAPPAVVATASEVRNASAKVPCALAYDPELAELAYDFYKTDFETFGYERDSWRYEPA